MIPTSAKAFATHQGDMSDLEFSLFQTESKVPNGLKTKSWDLSLPISNNWKGAKQRILMIVDHVPEADLKERQLMSADTFPMFLNLLNRSQSIVNDWGIKYDLSDVGLCFINFNYFKTYDLKHEDLATADRASKERILKAIKKLNPTHIHVFGDATAKYLFEIEHYQRGLLINKTIEGEKRKVSSNLSITRQSLTNVEEDPDVDDDDAEGNSIDDDGYGLGIDRANLLGHCAELLARTMAGKYPYSIAHVKPTSENCFIIKTMKQWKKLYKKLLRAPCFAYDLETKNLTITQNAILTAQFSLDDQQAWMLPVRHKDAPWIGDQLEEILFDLRNLFGRRFDHRKWRIPYLIGQNLMFDLRVTRYELGLPIIYYRIWDLMAGEHAHDENLKALPNTSGNDDGQTEKARPYALDVIMARYQNYFYQTATFSKGDRHNIEMHDLDEHLIAYGCMDVLGPFAIHTMQRARARLMILDDGENWGPHYDRLILGVYSDTIHEMSHMIEDGVPVDSDYIAQQYAFETSSIIKEKDQLVERLYDMPSVQKANQKMVKKLALPSMGMFDGLKDKLQFDSAEGDTITQKDRGNWVFNISTNDHKQQLFFKTLKLDPIKYTKGGVPSIGKAFLKFHSKPESNHYIEEVAIYSSITESNKVIGYLKNYWIKCAEPDGQYHSRLHAGYGFSMVLTGRANSFRPSFQQIPQHGVYAKIVKRCFVAPKDCVKIEADYKFHEVGCWCLMSNDKTLAKVLKRIWNINLQFRIEGTPEKHKVQIINDFHKLNYSGFTGVKVEKVTAAQRQSSKGITFGVIFGKAVRTLARDLGYTDEEMQKIFDKFFGAYHKAKSFLDWSVENAQRYLYTYNPFKLIRHLPGHMAAIRSLSSAMNRRAMNSPIQGFASQISFVAARLFHINMVDAFIQLEAYGKAKFNRKTGRIEMTKPGFSVSMMVHDATKTYVEYRYAQMAARIQEYSMTTGVMDYITKMYGFKFVTRLQVDFDIGDSGDKMKGWNMLPTESSELTAYLDEIEANPKNDPPARGWDRLILLAANDQKKRIGSVDKKQIEEALKPSKAVRKIIKQYPLDLTPYKDL